MLMKYLGGNHLVSGSATIEFVLICSIDNYPLCTLYLTVRNLIFICLDFAELLLLLEYRTADLLSQNNLNDLTILSTTHNPVTKFCYQISLLKAL